VSPPQSVTLFSPAKINLFLAVTGRRTDGYHDLVSVAAPLTFGDDLTAETESFVAKAGEDEGRKPEGARQFSLECDDPEVPVDETNLVLTAAGLFREATGWREPVAFRLHKRIPVGAGLGGGSSNAVAALRALNQLSGAGLDHGALASLAARVGSDCPLFLHGGPVVMRGRGERVEPLPGRAAERLRGRQVLLFKPAGFSVSTAWAYARMTARVPTDYLPAAEAERRLATWMAGTGGAEDVLFNNMEPAVFQKFIALPALLERVRVGFGLAPRMSGSGSACFALLPADSPVEAIIACIREAWGAVCFVQTTTIA
jgi:4-diphosphocytidyl-2-C-methyl-D-erythritol kinase